MADLKAVVFDMDDTLLSINLSAFIAMYAMDEADLLAKISRKRTFTLFSAYASAMLDLNNAERDEGDTRTNFRYFFDALETRCGLPYSDPAVLDALDFYEREILPRKNDRVVSARPREGAQKAVETVLDHGYRIALLTNPSFSRACIECRMAWGDMLDMPFELVTTWENSTRCKPDVGYYREALDKLGLAPEETLMVGNDPKRDFPAASFGLQTAYVGMGTPKRALWCGSMADFAANFNEIEERFHMQSKANRET